jgi:hypothetical protein
LIQSIFRSVKFVGAPIAPTKSQKSLTMRSLSEKPKIAIVGAGTAGPTCASHRAWVESAYDSGNAMDGTIAGAISS